MKILGIIPARGGSKGIPGKNIKPLRGRPLLAYTVDAVQASSRLEKVILSTDDPKIREIGMELGVEAPFLRPQNLSDDAAPAIGYLSHALSWMLENGQHFDAVCILQPTTPFRSLALIDQAAEKFIDSGADCLFTAVPVPSDYNPHWVFEARNDGMLKIATGEEKLITRRQELPPCYIRDGALYFTKSEVILSRGSIYGDKIAYFENSSEYYVNLDTMEDWERAVAICDQLKGKLPT